MIHRKTIFSILSAGAMLISGCSSDSITAEPSPEFTGVEGSSKVIFSINLDKVNTQSRASGNVSVEGSLGGASMVDYLLFAIYDADNNLLPQFALDGFSSVTIGDKIIKAGEGRNVVLWEGETVNIEFPLIKPGTYTLACWAQSSQCDAYDTSDLSAVKVSYDGALNNDETRDAFCKACQFTVSETSDEEIVNVLLTRPFSQINIGTTGADYANLIYDPYLVPSNVTVTESRVKVTGVANRLNVLTAQATAESPSSVEAVFDWATLPAWIFSGQPDFAEPGQTQYPKDENPFIKLPADAPTDEVFLKVKLNESEDELRGYLTAYPTKDDDLYLTETFKYLSMCYVLVPSSGNANGSTVTVSYDLRQNKRDGSGPIALTERRIQLVPVNANYRTNIIGGIYDVKENTDGTLEEPDPTSIFNFYQLPVILNDKFTDDYISRYYKATVNVYRDRYIDDHLTITSSTDGDITVPEAEIFSFSAVFTGEKTEYLFKVDQGFEVTVAASDMDVTDADGKQIWNIKWTADGALLTICSGASAGVFTVRVIALPPKP